MDGFRRMSMNDYAALKALVRKNGLLEPQTKYYTSKLAYTVAMLASVLAMLALTTGWLRVLLVAPSLAFVCTQIAFLAHDLGHKQVFTSNRLNNWAGMLVGNLVVGISLAWWNKKHNAHHANPNHEDMDPDIDIPFMAFSK